MHPEPRKLGEMLVGAGLIAPGQLQEALRHQRIAGGRMGSNLVALGMVSEDTLMDFLAQKTGVPRLDVKNLDVPLNILERIPRRLAEQMNILPVGFKEPRSLILAMADPLDLNASDSARFASGLNIEPMVVSHSALRQAIHEQYRKLDPTPSRTAEMVVGLGTGTTPNTFGRDSLELIPTVAYGTPSRELPRDPFTGNEEFLGNHPNPFAHEVPRSMPEVRVIHDRAKAPEKVRNLETIPTRALVLGLIRLFQRRGILVEDELQRFITNLLESGELDEGPPERD
jgi:hypothetical protein